MLAAHLQQPSRPLMGPPGSSHLRVVGVSCSLPHLPPVENGTDWTAAVVPLRPIASGVTPGSSSPRGCDWDVARFPGICKKGLLLRAVVLFGPAGDSEPVLGLRLVVSQQHHGRSGVSPGLLLSAPPRPAREGGAWRLGEAPGAARETGC